MLKAEDAIELKEPPRLTRIEIKPAIASIRPGESITFSASCFDQHGRPFEGAKVTWSATGGTIDQEGRFSAEEVGDYRDRGPGDSLVGTAEVQGRETAPPPRSPPPPKGFAWQGAVPPQKWMNFYTKVLSSLVSNPGPEAGGPVRGPPRRHGDRGEDRGGQGGVARLWASGRRSDAMTGGGGVGSVVSSSFGFTGRRSSLRFRQGFGWSLPVRMLSGQFTPARRRHGARP